ncbi:flagellar hook protein FlgE [Acetobacter estunensis NRIC 0472]|uniref:Flagellar hook protein FlgE n=1 Tax=Acetobacter estunensis TaxID=104097 RepID=A0A967EE36_9PROT|nr:flagellar hook-basal body complex protein [Acetobacter estunensis]NHO54936.1 flagellar hook-basal body complex protein [Acetobacter estunensis]GBQ26969.1 flagellar hook protein FlgE [Acetobacter estunensis NRIC 0472]
MSIFNSLYTADSGMNAQSTAFTNLSNNIANSQTTGYKATDTTFQDFVANSLSSYTGQAVSDGVGAVSRSQVQKQGTISTSTNSLAVAISGNGFFDVSKVSGQATSGKTSFGTEQYFTRNGDFETDKSGYLVNTSGYYLNGYMADPTTGVLSNDLTQINVSNIAFRPTETTTLTMSGGLPDAGYTTTQTIYDSTGQQHTLQLDWTKDSNYSTDNPVWDVKEVVPIFRTGR